MPTRQDEGQALTDAQRLLEIEEWANIGHQIPSEDAIWLLAQLNKVTDETWNFGTEVELLKVQLKAEQAKVKGLVEAAMVGLFWTKRAQADHDCYPTKKECPICIDVRICESAISKLGGDK